MARLGYQLTKTFRAKPSGGLIHAQLLAVQAAFFVIYIILIFTGAEINSVTTIGGSRISEIDIVLILTGVLLQMLFSVFLFAEWQRTEYRITDKDLEITRGIFATDTQAIELANIVSMSIHKGLIAKHYKYGTVRLKIGFDEKPVVLEGVPFPEQFLDILQAGIAGVQK